MNRQLIACISLGIYLLIFTACGKSSPTPAELSKIKELKEELELTQKEISDAKDDIEGLSGGLLQALYQVRFEILRTNEALIKQRIHSLESGAEITVETKGTSPNPEEASKIKQEIKEQEKRLKAAKEEALNSGGLIGAMKYAVVATNEQTIAMLRQSYLVAKYGLPFPQVKYNPLTETATPPKIEPKDHKESQITTADKKITKEIISVKLLSKKYTEQDYQDFIFFDLEFQAIGLDKEVRAIKGALNIEDLFGEIKLRVGWTIDVPLKPGDKKIEKGTGFKFNQFSGEHQWIRATELKNMKASFTVKSIIYKDGSRRDL